MVKNSQLKKSELLEILSSATSSKERNKVAKLLKRFDPLPQKEMDGDFDPRDVKFKKYQNLQAFMCYRCDKVKQTNVKVHWSSPKGLKVICNTCYANLCSIQELEKARRENGFYGHEKK